jgi:hypothetical protein
MLTWDNKNVNPNGDNVVISNVDNISFLIFENCENWVKKKTLYVIFSTRCLDYPKNEIPHIVHLTNQHWMNQSFPCGYGFILQEEKKFNFFLEAFLEYL